MIKEVLIQARGLIAHSESWCQHDFAQNKSGTAVSSDSHQAVKFCSVGAILRITNKDSVAFSGAVNALKPFMLGHIGFFNDDKDRKHYEVLAAFDQAIEAAQ